jgi:hypothetical protein
MAGDLVKEAQKIQALKNEADSLSAKLASIRKEMQERIEALNKRIMPEQVSAHGRSKLVLKPRPVDDRLSISAGKAIKAGLKGKRTPEQTYAQAITAATKRAKELKIDKLSSSLVKRIEKKVLVAFNVASLASA